MKSPHLLSGRIRFFLLVLVTIIAISFATRLVLLITNFSSTDPSLVNIIGIFGIGVLFDLFFASYCLIPFVLILWLIPGRLYTSSWNKVTMKIVFFLAIFLLLFGSVSEYLFWDEFKTRFNFIAVDYLVYTTEVLGNVQQSYPLPLIIGVIVFVAAAVTWSVNSFFSIANDIGFLQRSKIFVPLLVLPILVFFLGDSTYRQFSTNAFANELAGNGPYELFSAYRNNSLDYYKFYPVIKDNEAFQRVDKALHEPSDLKKPHPFATFHHIAARQPEKKLNVVLISVESLTASYLNTYGGDQNITPNLDSLATQGIVFTNLYATGTRTVRGLEALSLSIPPTPGQSIVRRPHNENLFTMATVFREKGYDCKYIYGGYGYFDNMNYFFGNNGYDVVDRSALSDDEIAYENIWGVADENLFTLALREIEASIAKGKPVFTHIMTTSNHRPFTYPEGRIDIPSHTSRKGAVKYTDYAIGQFMHEARKRSWFNNTLFVITADHCASSAGKTELPASKYRIPMIVIGPNIDPLHMNTLMSQIDIAPTVLGMLNFSYDSKFFGYDIFKIKADQQRAFISTYQSLGFIEHDTLVVLSPMRPPQMALLHDDQQIPVVVKDPAHSQVLKDAIAWYQTASYAFDHGEMKK